MRYFSLVIAGLFSTDQHGGIGHGRICGALNICTNSQCLQYGPRVSPSDPVPVLDLRAVNPLGFLLSHCLAILA